MSEFKINELKKKKEAGIPIVSITAYDLFTAQVAEEAGVDFILVGDSLGNVVQGHATTIPVTIDETIYHTKIVMRAVRGTLVISDMPFGTFKVSTDETVHNALRIFKETLCGGVKMEGADETNLSATQRLTELGIPVMGHIGLLPQTVHVEGGYKIKGRTERGKKHLLSQAHALESAGAFLLILECVEAETAREITQALEIPVIGIGSGPYTDGQIMVIHDVLGMLAGHYPKFARKFADLRGIAISALKDYAGSVRERTYPAREEYVSVE